ncbi:MAG: hypothetical protein JW914_02250, partial [Syntrophaceae bacterium]|nr:hypothetical protein [Syntrophaceae bacterium]
MKNVIRLLALTTFLLFSIQAVAFAANGPSGFANVPWGSSRAQVEKIMTQQGFTFINEFKGNNGFVTLWYKGKMLDIAGELKMTLLNDGFCRGEFLLLSADGGANKEPAFWKFNSAIRAKYGSPNGFNTNNDGGMAQWYKLQAPGTSDDVAINIYYTKLKPPTLSNCTVEYINKGLEQKLAL